jgi:hypothetical protein
MAKGINKKLNDTWSVKVKERADYKCEYCGVSGDVKPLNSHHDFTRQRMITCWDVNNGTCLCVGCHTMSSKFSAHKTPRAYFKWLEGYKGKEAVDEMERKSQTLAKFSKKDKEDILDKLNRL